MPEALRSLIPREKRDRVIAVRVGKEMLSRIVEANRKLHPGENTGVTMRAVLDRGLKDVLGEND